MLPRAGCSRPLRECLGWIRKTRFLREVRRTRTAQHHTPPSVKRSHRVLERGHELEQLKRYCSRALERQRQIVFVTGEPGIGKMTLVDAYAGTLPNQHGMLVGRGQCVEQARRKRTLSADARGDQPALPSPNRETGDRDSSSARADLARATPRATDRYRAR
jgi:AAA ATPase domain